ncbi:MAG TPA: hypothetical protein VGQ83_20995 [Polyangia bacterium]
MARLALAAALVVLCAAPARAYNEATHEQLTRTALAGVPALAAPRPGVDAAALGRFRAYLHGLLSQDRDFAARYPSADAFDAWALKELLSLSPEARVNGIDVAPASQPSAQDLIAVASRQPDEDGRNQNRFAHDARRQVLKDRYGQPLPDDPATLDMGGLTGLSSQGHAHCQLLPGPKSSDPAVLKRDPARFAIPPDAHTFAAVFAQRFYTLALIARRWDDPAAPALSDLFFGHALHYVQDVGNQIHAVQVGIYDFFVDAKIESYKEDLKSLGGLLRARPAFRTIGIGIIENHHLLAENLLAKRLREAARGQGAAAAAALAAIRQGDAEYEAALGAALHPGPGGPPADAAARAVALLVVRSAPEGPQVYQLARGAAVRLLSRARFAYTDADDPDAFIRPDAAGRAALAALYALEARGVARGASATRLLWRQQDVIATAVPAPVLAAGLARDAAAMRADAARRRAAYVPDPPSQQQINYWVPAGGLVALLLAGLAVRRLWRRVARRRAARAATRV